MFHLQPPWKRLKTKDFVAFSENIERIIGLKQLIKDRKLHTCICLKIPNVSRKIVILEYVTDACMRIVKMYTRLSPPYLFHVPVLKILEFTFSGMFQHTRNIIWSSDHTSETISTWLPLSCRYLDPVNW